MTLVMNSGRLLLLSAAVLSVSAGAVFAKEEQPGPKHITKEAAVKVAADAGYKDARDIDFDNDTPEGEWELEAFNASGKKFDIEINATTGKIVKTEQDD